MDRVTTPHRRRPKTHGAITGQKEDAAIRGNLYVFEEGARGCGEVLSHFSLKTLGRPFQNPLSTYSGFQ